MTQRGMTIVELMIGTALLVGGGGALLMGMHYAVAHSDYLVDFQVAMNAAQARLEELAATDFTALTTDARYAAARTAAGQCTGLGEDWNCNGDLDPGEDLNGNGQLDEPLVNARLTVHIRDLDGSAPDGNSTLLNIHAAACWSTRGRAMSEDLNCNGQLDAGEDTRVVNGLVDSPAMASTRVAIRE
jgi:type II secretory pathway pseudopilin PulG